MNKEEYNARTTAFAMWAINEANGDKPYSDKINMVSKELRNFIYLEILYLMNDMIRGYRSDNSGSNPPGDGSTIHS